MTTSLWDWFLRTFIYRYWYMNLDLDRDEHYWPDVEAWIKHNVPGKAKILNTRYHYDMMFGFWPETRVCFKRKEDLMAFKLWIS